MSDLKKSDPSPEALAAELLGCWFDELVARRMSFGGRLADRVAAIGGSWGFIKLGQMQEAVEETDHTAAGPPMPKADPSR
jgi:hypothetical protein